ncbi:MAG TPA: peptidylprolyl isomerase [Candidatus Dormibacteraeota bacterium]|jgi:cyclophilin family peptidyl-prolyl cis-trans isomerase|nr:peptidylprolyl isomerase [Candidatus Dormibacteraeota bacterium]
MSTTPEPHGRTVPTVIALVVLVAALVAVGVGVNRVAGSGSGAGVPTPTPSARTSATPASSPTPSSSATSSASPLANLCAGASFGAALQPLNPPSDIHVYPAEPAITINTAKLYRMTITTAKGTMVACLEPSIAPHTVNVIVTLARNHFFDGLKFHRVVAGFVIQGGDPQGTGSGGPGFKFNDEPVKGAYADGALAMANSGANTNGSQFFVCLPPVAGGSGSCATLPQSYNLFGTLESGLDVATKVVQGDVMTTVTVREQQ